MIKPLSSAKGEDCFNRHRDSFSLLDAGNLPDSRFLQMSGSSFTRLPNVAA
jgi:hypothetical protein